MPPGTGAGRSADARQKLLDLLAPVVTAAGYELDDVTVTPAGRRSLVRVTVDAEGGVDLDAVAEVSRAVSKALDSENAPSVAGPYVLEVSSPGVDRPLTEPRHWRRAVGRLVRVAVAESTVEGRVALVTEHAVVLDTGGVRREIPFTDLGTGKVQVEFHRPGADDGRDTSEED
jgi:ribosome maturation factor RimP